MAEGGKAKKGKAKSGDPEAGAARPANPASPMPVETEVLVRERQAGAVGKIPGVPLAAPAPVAHCFRCKRKDILVMAVMDGKLVGLCPDHFKLDVMTYVP